MTKYVEYLRFSSDLQRDTSIEDQRALCDKRALELGWVKVGEYADRGLTGTTMHRRHDLMRMLDDAEDGKFDVVVCEHTDRLSRDMSDLPYIYKCLLHHNIRIFSVSDNDFINPMHLAMRGYQNSQFSKDLGQKVRRGQAGAFKRGVLMGRALYGYDHIDGKRVINEQQAEVVRRIYSQYAAGVPAIEIVEALNADGLKTRAGAPFTENQLFGTKKLCNGILRNPMYIGKWRWGVRNNRMNPRTGRQEQRAAPPEDVEVIDMPELRIVDDQTWNAVQARVETAGSPPLHARKKPRHLLSGKLVCDECRRGYVCSGTGSLVLRCSGHSLSRICGNRRRVSRERVENAVLEALQTKLLSPGILDAAIKEYCAEHNRRSMSAGDDLAVLRKKEVQRDREIARLMEALKSGSAQGPVSEYIKAEMNSLLIELEQIRSDIKSASLALPSLDPVKVVERLKIEFANIAQRLSGDGPDAAQARNVLRALITKIVITPVGEPTDKRGGGAVSIRIEGEYCQLLGLGSEGAVRVIQTDTRYRGGQCDPNLSPRGQHMAGTDPDNEEFVSRFEFQDINGRTGSADRGVSVDSFNPLTMWYVEAALEEAHRPKLTGARKYIDTPFVLAALRASSGPLTIWDIAEQFVGEPPRRPKFDMIRQRIQRCLNYLRSRGVIEPVKMAGRRGIGWRLSMPTDNPIQQVVEPTRKRPEALLNAHERAKLIGILADAGQALETAEVARRLLVLNNEEVTESRIKRAVSSVRVWLARLRDDQIVRSVKSATSSQLCWELVNCCDHVAGEFAANLVKRPRQELAAGLGGSHP